MYYRTVKRARVSHFSDRVVTWSSPWENVLRTWRLREDSDQTAHSRSLIRIFTERILDSQACKASSCGQRRLWSDCADAQAYLSLHWVHVVGDMFYHVATHLVMVGAIDCLRRALLPRKLSCVTLDWFIIYIYPKGNISAPYARVGNDLSYNSRVIWIQWCSLVLYYTIVW